MSDQDLKEMLEAFKTVRADILSSPEKARAFFVKAGILTPSGELTEHYRPSA